VILLSLQGSHSKMKIKYETLFEISPLIVISFKQFASSRRAYGFFFFMFVYDLFMFVYDLFMFVDGLF